MPSKKLYKISIDGMRLRLTEVNANNQQAKEIKAETTIKKDKDDVDKVLHFQGLLYIPEIIYIELISQYHNNLLVAHFEIEKTRELVTEKYY